MPRADDERALTPAFTRHGRRSGWKDSPEYLLRSLPAHAAAAGLVDDLLADDAYLLHADLRRLIRVADDTASEQGRRRARLLRLTPRAVTAGPADRAALFSVTEALDDLGASYRDGDWPAPYQARWASVKPRSERAVLEGHQGWVNGGVPGHRRRAGAAGQRRRRWHGADLGPPDRRAARRPRRPPGLGLRRVRGHRRRTGAAGQRRRRWHGADLGPRDRPAARHRWKATRTGSGRCARSPSPGGSCWPAAAPTARCGSGTPKPASSAPSLEGHQDGVWAVCPVTVAGRETAGQRRQRRHGPDLGPRNRPAALGAEGPPA